MQNQFENYTLLHYELNENQITLSDTDLDTKRPQFSFFLLKLSLDILLDVNEVDIRLRTGMIIDLNLAWFSLTDIQSNFS